MAAKDWPTAGSRKTLVQYRPAFRAILALWDMEKVIRIQTAPGFLNSRWDDLAGCYFQKRAFLELLHTYNPCAQRYYELYRDGTLAAGAVVYTLSINIFTFSGMPGAVRFQVVGLPVSVAAPPVIGDPEEFGCLLSEILKREHGVILGLNLTDDCPGDKVIQLRMLPTVVLHLPGNSFADYENHLRHAYRRRLGLIRRKFARVTSTETGCGGFTPDHYSLYLQIMKRTRTKLETLAYDLFVNLPTEFRLTTYYSDHEMLAWHIVCRDNGTLFFFFGGMNYALRDRFLSYHNNLCGIIETACRDHYRTIDFGQTAEVAKTRLGGILSERRMFLYHRNRLIFGLLKLSGSFITYSKVTAIPRVFRNTIETEKNRPA